MLDVLFHKGRIFFKYTKMFYDWIVSYPPASEYAAMYKQTGRRLSINKSEWVIINEANLNMKAYFLNQHLAISNVIQYEHTMSCQR